MKRTIFLKHNLRLILSCLLSLGILEISYHTILFDQYAGQDNIINLAVRLCGTSRTGYMGVLFPVMAALPCAHLYMQDENSGMLIFILQRQRRWIYMFRRIFRSGFCGGIALMLPFSLFILRLLPVTEFDHMKDVFGQTVVSFRVDMAEKTPVRYLLMLLGLMFLCGVAMAELSLGISAWIHKEIVCILFPLLLVVGHALTLGNHKWDLFVLYSPNANFGTSLDWILRADMFLMLAGILMFCVGVQRHKWKRA